MTKFLLHAFSLLELLLVLAIISILSMIAIPSYQTYLQRAKFTEVILAVAPYKLAVLACAERLGGLVHGRFNCGTAGQQGIPPAFHAATSSKGYTESVAISYQAPQVVITARSQHLKNTYDYRLVATYQPSGQIEWTVDANSSCLSAGLC